LENRESVLSRIGWSIDNNNRSDGALCIISRLYMKYNINNKTD